MAVIEGRTWLAHCVRTEAARDARAASAHAPCLHAGPLADVRNWLAPRSGPALSFEVSTTSTPPSSCSSY